jgi:hypothetical protein
MQPFLQFHLQKKSGFVCALSSGILILGLALAAPAADAGMGGGAGAAAGAGGGAAGAGGGGGAGSRGTVHRPNGQTEVTICPRGMVLNTKDRKCLAKHSEVRPGARVD